MSAPENAPKSGCWVLISAILALYQIILAIRVFILQQTFSDWQTLSPLWQGLLAVIWGVLFTGSTIELLRRKIDAVRYTSWLIIVFLVTGLMKMIIFTQGDYFRQRLPLLITASFILVVMLIVNLRQRSQHLHK